MPKRKLGHFWKSNRDVFFQKTTFRRYSMNYLKLPALLALSFYLSSCGPPTPGAAPAAAEAPIRTERDYEEQRANNSENRRRTFERSRQRYSGSACEDEDRDHECKEQCKDIYTRRSDREDCEELKTGQIEKLEELHKLLKDPDDDDLAEFDLEDFKVYLDISTSPFDKLVGKYSKSESKEILLWIAENEDVAELMEDKDDDFKTLQRILKRFKSGVNDATLYEYFTAKISGSDRLMEVVIDSGNEPAHNWFLDFINEKDNECSDDTETVGCFFQYCKIGIIIDNDIAEDWLSFEDFDEYIEDIIDEKVNGHATAGTAGCWDTTGNDAIEDLGEINNWVDDLCKPNGGEITRNNGSGCLKP